MLSLSLAGALCSGNAPFTELSFLFQVYVWGCSPRTELQIENFL